MIRFVALSVRSFLRRDDGQDLIEYALIAALIALGAVTAMTAVGGDINAAFDAIGNAITDAVS